MLIKALQKSAIVFRLDATILRGTLKWRRQWDSNPREHGALPDFKSGAIGRYAMPPTHKPCTASNTGGYGFYLPAQLKPQTCLRRECFYIIPITIHLVQAKRNEIKSANENRRGIPCGFY